MRRQRERERKREEAFYIFLSKNLQEKESEHAILERERGSFYILLLKNLWEREKERADPKNNRSTHAPPDRGREIEKRDRGSSLNFCDKNFSGREGESTPTKKIKGARKRRKGVRDFFQKKSSKKQL